MGPGFRYKSSISQVFAFCVSILLSQTSMVRYISLCICEMMLHHKITQSIDYNNLFQNQPDRHTLTQPWCSKYKPKGNDFLLGNQNWMGCPCACGNWVLGYNFCYYLRCLFSTLLALLDSQSLCNHCWWHSLGYWISGLCNWRQFQREQAPATRDRLGGCTHKACPWGPL
jgi:hypothetical protein